MELNVKWHKPIKLIDGSNQNLIYTIKGLNDLCGTPGVYMFCRQYAASLTPLYIGKAEDIGKRIKQQLNTTKLMKGIDNYTVNGNKVLVIGEFLAKPGQEKKKSISIIERALIEHSLSEGHELLNIQGTKTPINKINFSGYLGARNLTGQNMNVAIKKG